jgi:flagellar biosynthetic protein FliQ
MTQANIITVVQSALYTIIIVCAPILAVSLVVGFIVAIFQATTQINEATLSFAPKIIAIFVTIIVCGPWILNKLVDFTTKLFEYINTIS